MLRPCLLPRIPAPAIAYCTCQFSRASYQLQELSSQAFPSRPQTRPPLVSCPYQTKQTYLGSYRKEEAKRGRQRVRQFWARGRDRS